jgi:hypothetical protein
MASTATLGPARTMPSLHAAGRLAARRHGRGHRVGGWARALHPVEPVHLARLGPARGDRAGSLSGGSPDRRGQYRSVQSRPFQAMRAVASVEVD